MEENQNVNARQTDDSFYIRQNELTQKYVKLQVLQDLFKSNDAGIEDKKRLLKEENAALDKLHHDLWTLENQVCDKVWAFSEKHNFNTILNNYPDIPSELILDCECDVETSENLEDRAETQRLLLEIQNLKTDLEIEECNGLEEDLVRVKRELQECEKETPEMQRLKDEINECKRRITNLEAKKEMNSDYNLENLFTEDYDYEPQLSPVSSVSTTCSAKINSCTLQPQKVVNDINNSNFKRKCIESSDKSFNNGLHFVKASDYMRNVENQAEINNNTDLPLGGTNTTISNKESKKKFVFKQKSLITRRQMR